MSKRVPSLERELTALFGGVAPAPRKGPKRVPSEADYAALEAKKIQLKEMKTLRLRIREILIEQGWAEDEFEIRNDFIAGRVERILLAAPPGDRRVEITVLALSSYLLTSDPSPYSVDIEGEGSVIWLEGGSNG